MALFWQRTKNQLTAPAQYIQTTDKVSRPMAVMSALVMFFVGLAIIIGLIFASVWGYHKITGKNSKPASPITSVSTGESSDANNSSTSQKPNGSATVISNGAGTTTVTNQQASTTASITGSTTSSSVPNTGAGSTVTIFVIATIVGTLLHRAVLIRKL